MAGPPWPPSRLLPAEFVVVERGLSAARGALARGDAALQDEAAAAVIALAAPAPGDALLDVCAAPGGKALFAAARMGGVGRIVARDVSAPRASRVADAAAAQGVHPPFFTTDVGDGLALPSDPAHLAAFDIVLLDAPCSGTGVLAKRADLRWRRAPGDVAAAADLQGRLLVAASTTVRPGGVLVYSTCSLEPEENAGAVAAFLASEAGAAFQVEPPPNGALPPDVLTEDGRCLQTLPHVHGTDGAFGARLRRGGVRKVAVFFCFLAVLFVISIALFIAPPQQNEPHLSTMDAMLDEGAAGVAWRGARLADLRGRAASAAACCGGEVAALLAAAERLTEQLDRLHADQEVWWGGWRVAILFGERERTASPHLSPLPLSLPSGWPRRHALVRGRRPRPGRRGRCRGNSKPPQLTRLLPSRTGPPRLPPPRTSPPTPSPALKPPWPWARTVSPCRRPTTRCGWRRGTRAQRAARAAARAQRAATRREQWLIGGRRQWQKVLAWLIGNVPPPLPPLHAQWQKKKPPTTQPAGGRPCRWPSRRPPTRHTRCASRKQRWPPCQSVTHGVVCGWG